MMTIFILFFSGSAEFFYPGKVFNKGGGTKGYKPPEMLLNRLRFTYAYDLWGVGITMASLMFRVSFHSPSAKSLSNIDYYAT
jgi:serine/threonine protein kinase